MAAPSHAAGNPFGPLLPIQELLEALPPADREDKPAEPVIEDYASYASDDSAWELKEEEVNSPKRISVSTNVTRPITPVAFSASPKIIQQVASNILFDVINDVDRVVSPPMSPEVSMLTYSVDSVGAPSTSPLPPSDLAVVDVSTMSDVTSTNVMDVVDANPVAVTVDAPLILPRSRSPHITASTPQAVVDIEQQYESGSENNKPVLTIRPSLQLSVGEGSVTVAELLKPRYSLSVSKPVVIDLGLERQPLLMSSPQAAAALSGRLPHPKQQSLDVTVRSDGVTIEPDDNTNECSQLHDTPFIEHRPGSAYSVQRGASRRQVCAAPFPL